MSRHGSLRDALVRDGRMGADALDEALDVGRACLPEGVPDAAVVACLVARGALAARDDAALAEPAALAALLASEMDGSAQDIRGVARRLRAMAKALPAMEHAMRHAARQADALADALGVIDRGLRRAGEE